MLPCLNGGKSINSMFILKELTHDIVESSRYIPRDCLHMRTTEIDFNLGWLKKKNDNAKKRTTDARAKRSWVYRFWA